MTLSLKQDFIRAFFDDFGRKIERLIKLHAEGFQDEAFTLCIVYIDRLASGNYDSGPSRSAQAFCRALRELGGNPLHGMIHPRELLEQTRQWFPLATPLIESIVNMQPGVLLSESELIREIRMSSLAEPEKEKLISNLWRASMANICYDHIRNPQVHGPGSIGFTFDETTFDGRKGVRLDFQVLYEALHNIWREIRDTSVRTGEWFGRAGFLKSR